MTPNDQSDYQRGYRAAILRSLNDALRFLGHDAPHGPTLVAEREEAIVVLRELCKDFGDNDWPESLHLADIIDKHLAKHLYSRK